MHVLLLSTYTCFESFNVCLWFYEAYFYYYPCISMCLKYVFIKKMPRHIDKVIEIYWL